MTTAAAISVAAIAKSPGKAAHAAAFESLLALLLSVLRPDAAVILGAVVVLVPLASADSS